MVRHHGTFGSGALPESFWHMWVRVFTYGRANWWERNRDDLNFYCPSCNAMKIS